jgi:hypothetical protein
MGGGFVYGENPARKKIREKPLTNGVFVEYNSLTFEYLKNDCDEDGRIGEPGESWRLLRANGKTFQ